MVLPLQRRIQRRIRRRRPEIPRVFPYGRECRIQVDVPVGVNAGVVRRRLQRRRRGAGGAPAGSRSAMSRNVAVVVAKGPAGAAGKSPARRTACRVTGPDPAAGAALRLPDQPPDIAGPGDRGMGIRRIDGALVQAHQSPHVDRGAGAVDPTGNIGGMNLAAGICAEQRPGVPVPGYVDVDVGQPHIPDDYA